MLLMRPISRQFAADSWNSTVAFPRRRFALADGLCTDGCRSKQIGIVDSPRRPRKDYSMASLPGDRRHSHWVLDRDADGPKPVIDALDGVGSGRIGPCRAERTLGVRGY